MLVFLFAGAIGLRGAGLSAVAVLAIYPTYWLVLFITLRLFPVDLETTIDVRGLLRHAPEDSIVQSDPETEDVRAGGNGETPLMGRAPTFQQLKHPLSIAGVFLMAGGVVLASFMIWTAFSALRVRFWPSVIEVRNAPRGFPMRAEFGADAITFSNLSGESWSCDIAIGFGLDTAYRVSVVLPPNDTRAVRYGEFGRPASNIDPGVLRAVAREALWAECGDEKGRTHSGYLE